MIRAVLLDFGETLVERISDRDAPLTRLAPALFPETAAALDDLCRAGYLLAVVSNTDSTDDDAMDTVLNALGIRRYLSAVVTSTSIGSRKPGPTIFRHTLRRLRCRADEAVMVGDDASTDIAGGAALGMVTVLVRRNRAGAAATVANGADFVIGSLSELCPLVDRLHPPVTGS